jgi:hypothetical protein
MNNLNIQLMQYEDKKEDEYYYLEKVENETSDYKILIERHTSNYGFHNSSSKLGKSYTFWVISSFL